MNNSVDDLFKMSTPKDDVSVLDWTDYTGFLTVFGITALIGIYFGCFGKENKTADDFSNGGKKMKAIPVALSLVASHSSGIMLICVPAEVYTHNALYILTCLTLILACVCSWYLFLPVFFNLDIQNSYEYVELRFSKRTKNLASVIYVLSTFLYLPFTIYVPALSLSQVTGINIYYISVGVSAVCTFYTTMGGLKAFVWSDCFQTVILVLVTLTILTVGTINAGGLPQVFSTASQGRILDIYDMKFDPFVRNTFWTMIIGSFCDLSCVLIAQQDSIQRLKSVPTMKDIKVVLLIFWMGTTGMQAMSVYSGILVYSVYFGCDPIERELVGEPDQVLPFYILDKIGHLAIIPGLFIAGILSGGLSYMAALLNTSAAFIYNTYIKRDRMSIEREKLIIRALIVFSGIYTVAMIPLVENMGTVLPVMLSMDGITAAPCLAFFVLGMLVPFCNDKGAIAGALSSMAVLTWIIFGSSMEGVHSPTKHVYPGIPNTCNSTISSTHFNFTQSDETSAEDANVFFLYRLSFMYYITFGLIIDVTVAIVVSLLTGGTDLTRLDPNLISPPLRKYLPARIGVKREEAQCELISDVKKMEKY